MLSFYNNKFVVLAAFFKEPTEKLQLREISRKTNIALPSTKKYLEILTKENLILKQQHRLHNYPIYIANTDSNMFKQLKKSYTLSTIQDSKLVQYIKDNCMPDAIILFGSASKGEDIQTSDIDLYIKSKQKNVNLEKYEKILNKKINLLFEQNFNKLSSELKNNILNGTILTGYLEAY